MTEAVFWFFAVVAVIAALACILQRNPIAAALCLVQVMFSLAAIFVLLDAQFIAVIQVLVYAGAVVLFLFVIMLLNLQEEPVAFAPGSLVAVAVAGGIGLAIAVTVGLARTPLPSAALTKPFGGTEPLAERLFTTYLLPFELTSVLLLVAIIGAVVLGKKRLP